VHIVHIYVLIHIDTRRLAGVENWLAVQLIILYILILIFEF